MDVIQSNQNWENNLDRCSFRHGLLIQSKDDFTQSHALTICEDEDHLHVGLMDLNQIPIKAF